MKNLVLVSLMATLVTVGACSGGGEESAAGSGNVSAVPPGAITATNAYDIRHPRYEKMGDAMKAISRELKGDAPDVAVIQREAATLVMFAEQVKDWFPLGSGPENHPKTRAKTEIWSDADGFRQAHELYLAQAQSFKRVADDGQVEQIRAAVGSLGKSCSNCHDRFRGPER